MDDQDIARHFWRTHELSRSENRADRLAASELDSDLTTSRRAVESALRRLDHKATVLFEVILSMAQDEERLSWFATDVLEAIVFEHGRDRAAELVDNLRGSPVNIAYLHDWLRE